MPRPMCVVNLYMSSQRIAAGFGLLLLSLGCSDESPVEPRLTPASISITSGAGQSFTAGTRAPLPVEAQVRAADGRPVPGVLVEWKITAGIGDADLEAFFDTTDAAGVASTVVFTVRGAGPVYLQATAWGVREHATTTLIAVPDVPARIEALAPLPAAAPVGVALHDSLRIAVRDRFGNAIPNAPLSFEADRGAFLSTPATTGQGTAAASFRMPDEPGQVTITVTSPGVGAVTQSIAARPPVFRDAAIGVNVTCALTTEGYAFCWGDDGIAQLGVGAAGARGDANPIPLPVAGGHLFHDLDVDGGFGCAVAEDFRAYCWGAQDRGETGAGVITLEPAPVPVQVRTQETIAEVAAGTSHACARRGVGGLVCWGGNLYGESGANGCCGGASAEPALVQTPDLRSLSAGSTHSCGLDLAGRAYCWGSNEFGQLGATATGTCRPFAAAVPCATQPIAVATDLRFKSISAGWHHTCALTTGGAGYCWGSNDFGQLGTGSQTSAPTPVPVAGGLTFTELWASDRLGCGLTAAGAVYCWGLGTTNVGVAAEECPVGEPGWFTACQPTPTRLPTAMAFSSIRVGGSTVCGFSAGVLYCWGSNYRGSLGDGTTESRTAPTRVSRQ